MAKLTHAESRRLYSWWWDSHISPKNSKWLQENLSDMDSKVKSMIKLIEEDADSFARRAEMYYKKRPELMKLVEEFYRAYRALAERYDHATGALRQAHRTMAEAFPNQVPSFSDDSPTAASTIESEPRTPGAPPIRSFFDSDGSNNIERNGAYDDNDSLTSKRSVNSKYRKGQDDEGLEEAFEKIKNLQEKISQLSSENDTLKTQVDLDSENKNKAENEIQRLKETQSKLQSEKEAISLNFQQCLERVVVLEAEIEKFTKLNAELLVKVDSLEGAEEICSLLEKEKQSLYLKVDGLEQKTSEQQEQLMHKQEQLERLKTCVQDEQLRAVQAEAALGALEELHAQSQEQLRISSLDIQNGVQILKEMESKKQALEEDIRHVREENENLSRELKQKQEELEKLNAAVENEHLRSVQAEAALHSLEKLHAQSQEDLKLLMLDIQSKVHTLNDVESRKQHLEEELRKLKEQIRILNEQNISSQLMIRNLQNEILSLKEAQSKLENEMRHHADGKEVLKKELHDLKEEMDGLRLRHKGITDQLEAVGLNGISLQASVKELRDGNLELKEICKKQEDKNVLLLERLEHFEKVSEKNVILENSLSDANVELEGLREKIKVLQESYEDLGVKHSALIAEKTVLVYKVETITENMGKLLENNTFLENSLSDANVELEALRGQLRSLEESCQVLHDDKSSLQREKNILYSQVDLIGRNLENLEKKYTELHDRHSNLDREKELTQNQLTKLHDISKLEKEEHEAFKLSTISRLTSLEDQISLLREESGCKEQQFETEQIKFLGALIEIFILQRCVADLNYGNLSLSNENHKLEQDMLAQKEKAAILLDHIGRLRNGMWKVLKDLDTNGGFELSNASEELCWQFILDKVRALQDFAFKTEDENLGLIFENSVNAILLQQLGLDIADLKSEKSSVEQDCRMKTEKLLLVQAEKCDLLRTKEQLKENMASGYKREAILKEEMEIIGRQLSELKDAQCVSQDENCQLLEERQLLLAKLFSLGKEQELLEDEHVAILQELVTLDCLYLQYEQLSAERTRDLKTIINELKCSHEINSDLGNKVDMISAKLRFVEAENLQLKDLTSKFEECKTHVTISAVEASMTENVNDELNCQIDQLNQQIETGNALLIEKEKELSEAHVKFQDLQNQDEDLRRNLEDTKREAEESKAIRDGLEEKLSLLSENVINSEKELALIHEENVVLVMELQKLKTENEELRVKKEKLTSLLQNEVECCEDEVAALCTDIQTTTVHAVVSEEKLMELMGVCEELEMKNLVERRALIEEVNLRDAHIEKLCGKVDGLEGENRRMKSELDEYLPVISSLQDSISSLESFIVPSSKTHTKDHHEVQDFSVKRIEHDQGGKEQYEEPRGGVPEGILELQNLLAKVDAIHEILVHSGSHLVLNNINLDVKIDKQGQEIEETRLQKSSHELNNVVTTEAEVCSDKDVLIMKDIQLDHASSSSKYDLGADSYEISVGDSTDTNDPSLESWETAEKDGKNKVQRLPISTHSDIIYRKIEAEEEEKSEYPSSELVMEKELGVDKLEVLKKDEGSHQDWNKKVLETLTSDAQRLCVLQTRVQDLKNKMDDSEKSNYPKNSEYNSVKGWLQEAEEAIHLLFERNKKLTKKAEDFSAPPYNSKVEEPNDEIGQWRRQVSGRARRGSDRIGKWELELQKIQYILLKFEEELEYQRAKDSEKRRVLLRDYLYGRGDNRRKKRNFCCTRPAVKDD